MTISGRLTQYRGQGQQPAQEAGGGAGQGGGGGGGGQGAGGGGQGACWGAQAQGGSPYQDIQAKCQVDRVVPSRVNSDSENQIIAPYSEFSMKYFLTSKSRVPRLEHRFFSLNGCKISSRS